jgi:hypothetical protein
MLALQIFEFASHIIVVRKKNTKLHSLSLSLSIPFLSNQRKRNELLLYSFLLFSSLYCCSISCSNVSFRSRGWSFFVFVLLFMLTLMECNFQLISPNACRFLKRCFDFITKKLEGRK